MSNVLMSCEDAIAAIEQAQHVLIFVHTSAPDDSGAFHSKEFSIAKDAAIAAVKDIYGRGRVTEPNIELSDDGTTVTIGKEHAISLPENLSHFENNNGNF